MISKIGFPFRTAVRLRPWLEPERHRLIPGTIAVLVVGASALAIPVALKRLIDALMLGASAPMLSATGLLIVLFLINSVAGYFQGVLFHESAARVSERIRRALAGRWLRWPLERHHRHDIGSLLTVSTADVEAVYQVVAHGLAPIVQNGLTLGGGLVLIAWIRWPVALGLLVVLVVPSLWIRWQARRVTEAFGRSREALEHAGGALQSALAAIVDVKLYGAEAELEAAVAASLETGTRARMEAQRRQSSSSQVLYVMFCLVTLVVFVGGGIQRLDRQLDVPVLLMLYLYAFAVAHAAIGLYRTLGTFREANPALERIGGMLEGHTEGGDAPGLGISDRPAGSIRIRGLEFRYPGQAEPVLRGLDLDVEPGRWVVITGPSGSGKSTLLALLARLYTPDAGRIDVDDRPIEVWDIRALRRYIALAPQAAGVFPGTVEGNVRLGRPWLSDEAVQRALEVACLPSLQTLDARGENLSGGQRARLGIARALAGDPSILALDEATGALDAGTERAFWAALSVMGRDRTTLIVTHRPERVPHYDALFRLEDGRLVPVDGSAPVAAMEEAG